MYWHWNVKVMIIQEVTEPLPRCDHCGIHMPVARLIKRRRTAICEKATKVHLKWRDVKMAESFGEMYFQLVRERGELSDGRR